MAGNLKLSSVDKEGKSVKSGFEEGKHEQQQLDDGCNLKGVDSPAIEQLDDDGRIKRQGTVWSSSAMVMASMLGTGVIGLPWAFSELGWIGGSVVLLAVTILTWYTSILMCDCYRFMDPVSGRRLYGYPEAVSAYLGKKSLLLCAIIQYTGLVGACIAFTITAGNSMKTMQISQCMSQEEEGKGDCTLYRTSMFFLIFGLVQLVLSQIKNFSELWWLSHFSVFMSVTYSGIAIFCGLWLTTAGQNHPDHPIAAGQSHPDHGSLTGLPLGTTPPAVSQITKTFGILNAVGAVAYTYDLSPVLFYIEDTIRSPPSENVTMKRSSTIGVALTTLLYAFISVTGYAALGNSTPGDFLRGLTGYKPHWIVSVANLSVVAQLAASVQLFAQPVFDYVERFALARWPANAYIRQSYELKLPIVGSICSVHSLRLTSRTAIICLVTFIAILIPFFNSVLGLLGAISLWPMTVYFPIAMHMKRTSLRAWTSRWIALELLSATTFLVSMGAAVGAVQSIVSLVISTPIFS